MKQLHRHILRDQQSLPAIMITLLAALGTLASVSGFFPLQCRVTLGPLSQRSPLIVTYGEMILRPLSTYYGDLTNAQK
jgi:hypothetical protein